MSGLDVEALLDSTANAATSKKSRDGSPAEQNGHREHDRRYRERSHDRHHRDRSRDRARKDRDGDLSPYSPRDSDRGYRGSRRRSRSRDSDKRHSRRYRENGDYDNAPSDGHRGGGRSRSPRDDRHYRSSGGRSRRDDDDYDGHRRRRRTPSPRHRARSPTPQPTEDERDRRTVFVQQLAARLRTKELIAFFDKVGPVKEAQIVKDRISGRSKGVGYVEFKNEESVPLAIQLTGQKLLGIPIIAQLTEAEKNRQARNPEASQRGSSHTAPFHRLYVGNIHFNITESDLQNVFDAFGELEFVQLQRDDQNRSRGYGFIQFRDPDSARMALDKMNGFDLAGRPIRVGLGNDKFTPESTANILQRFQGQNGGSGRDGEQNYQGSSLYGSGGRGAQAGGGAGAFDRAGGRENEKGSGNASALDDTDVGGVNFNNYSRDALMRKLARTDDPPRETNGADARRPAAKPKTDVKPLPVNVGQASRCVLLRNMFDPAEEEGDSWVKELEDDVRAECNEKYGKVVHISVDPNTQGDIYLKFDRVTGGENAIKGLNGRFFGGRQISAQPVVDAVYSSLFSRTSAL